MKVYGKESLEQLKKKSVRTLAGIPHISSDVSPFRYPGGKGKLARFLAYFLVSNDLVGSRLVEPFCGGAGGTLPLLAAGLIERLVLNDLNPAMYSFWYSLKNHPDELIRLVRTEAVNIESWHHWRDVYSNDLSDVIERGFAAFFLNRTNRSGILHAGPIGGRDQSGEYKIDCRFNKSNLEKRIERIALLSESIDVHSMDASKLISELTDENDFIYADPPYVKEGKNIYKKYCFDDKLHFSFSETIKRSASKWLISYDDHPLVHSLYSKSGINVVEFSYVMNRARVGRELLIASSHLTLPIMPALATKVQPELSQACI
ncbi:MAG: DNA adenine methylase [Aeromonas sobria]